MTSQDRQSILKLVRTRVSNRADAEDIAQDVIIKLLTHEYKNKWGYIKSCVRTSCIDHYRRRAKYDRKYEGSTGSFARDPLCTRDVLDIPVRPAEPHLLIDFQRHFAALSPGMKATFCHEFLGIGFIVQTNSNTVKWRRHHLRKVLDQ